MSNVLVITKETTPLGKERKKQEALNIYPGASVTVMCSEIKSFNKLKKEYEQKNTKHKVLNL